MEISGVGVTSPSNFINKNEENNLISVSPVRDDGASLISNSQDNSQLTRTKNEKDKFSKFGKKDLSPEEQKRVEELKRVDQKVRAHEMAHIAAGGGLVRGGANFTYEIGPDGKQYAVGGEVKIDMSVNPDDPEGAIQKMQQVRRAALAPADPSPQDRSVAQQASNIEAQMRAKLMEEKTKPKNNLSKVYKTFLDFDERINYNDKSAEPEINPTPSVQSLKRKVNIIV
ncbi:MAG: putative metalloprotease CJM1_0395 family protein [Candidatus Kapaibacteriota bacterium]